MGRKSSAKSSSRPPSSEPPAADARSSTPLLVAALVVIVAIAGGFAYTRSVRDVAATRIRTGRWRRQSTDAAQAAPAVPLKPHKQANLPPLPFQAYAPPRPPESVRAAYQFRRRASGGAQLRAVLLRVRARRPQRQRRLLRAGATRPGRRHRMGAARPGLRGVPRRRDAMRSRCTRSGASVRDIRAAIEKKWVGAAAHGTHTPTPMPHAGH